MALFPDYPGEPVPEGKTNLDFTEARDSEWLGHMQICTSLQTDNNASTTPLSFLQAGCRSCRPTNSIKALKAKLLQAVKITSGTLAFFCLVSQGQARSLDISTSGSATENNSTEV